VKGLSRILIVGCKLNYVVKIFENYMQPRIFFQLTCPVEARFHYRHHITEQQTKKSTQVQSEN
jgi:hypothetical protein